MKHKEIFGDYVLTGVKNAFNSQTSWWLSKRYMTRAMYCFSTVGAGKQAADDLAFQITAIDSYIHAFAALFEEPPYEQINLQ